MTGTEWRNYTLNKNWNIIDFIFYKRKDLISWTEMESYRNYLFNIFNFWSNFFSYRFKKNTIRMNDTLFFQEKHLLQVDRIQFLKSK